MKKEELREIIKERQSKVGEFFSERNEYDYHLCEELIDKIMPKFHKAAVMRPLPTDDEIMVWSLEWCEGDAKAQASFRVMAKFMRECMKGNGA